MIGVIVAAIPWSAFDQAPEQIIEASVEQPPEEIIEEEEEIEEIEEETEPILEDFEVSDHNETDTNSEFEHGERPEPERGLLRLEEHQLDARHRRWRRRQDGRPLRRQQEPPRRRQGQRGDQGRLGVTQEPPGRGRQVGLRRVLQATRRDQADGIGDANHDIGVTGLALLAFLGDGHSMTKGSYKDVVTKGVKWLISQQDKETGLFGEKIGHSFVTTTPSRRSPCARRSTWTSRRS